jgi:hypothetical protein
MQGFSTGAGLAALAFWGFIAAVVVAGIWYDIRKKESQHETIRRLFESGQPIDERMMDKLLSMGADKSERIDRGLKIAGLITLPAGIGLGIFGTIMGAAYPETQAPLWGAAALAGCVGLGLLLASSIAKRWYVAEDGSEGTRV